MSLLRLRRLQSLTAALAAALFMVVMSTPGFAQQPDEEFAEYTNEQQRLNEQGVRAIINKDYALAVALLEESSAIGELNVTYLNLGRAYQKLGDCQAAREAYERARMAPKVEAPSAAVVEKKIDEYSAELDEECKTSEEETAVDDQSVGPDAVEPVAAAPPSSTSRWGWAAVGGGVAVMGAGVGALVHAEALRSEITEATRDEQGFITSMTRSQALERASSARTFDQVGVGMLIGGALLTGGGVYLLVADETEPDTDESASQLGVRTGAGRLELVWTSHF